MDPYRRPSYRASAGSGQEDAGNSAGSHHAVHTLTASPYARAHLIGRGQEKVSTPNKTINYFSFNLARPTATGTGTCAHHLQLPSTCTAPLPLVRARHLAHPHTHRNIKTQVMELLDSPYTTCTVPTFISGRGLHSHHHNIERQRRMICRRRGPQVQHP